MYVFGFGLPGSPASAPREHHGRQGVIIHPRAIASALPHLIIGVFATDKGISTKFEASSEKSAEGCSGRLLPNRRLTATIYRHAFCVPPHWGCTSLYQLTNVVPARNHGPRRRRRCCCCCGGPGRARPPAQPLPQCCYCLGFIVLLLGSLLSVSWVLFGRWVSDATVQVLTWRFFYHPHEIHVCIVTSHGRHQRAPSISPSHSPISPAKFSF